MRKNNITKKIGIMILDNEGNYDFTTNFKHSILDKNIDLFDIYWICMPITLPCSTSAFMSDWICWGVDEEYKWVRPMPTNEYIVNFNNHKFPFFYENIGYQEFWDKFGEWYSEGKKTACMIGIRTDESLNRYRAIINTKKQMSDGHFWTKRNIANVFNVYPIYDWKTQDIWVANEKFGWEYNDLYNLFYKAGLTIGQMRVASPFMSEAKASLNMFRILEPHVWIRLVSRVHGANFMATYGKQIKYHDFKLPNSHTWKSFTKFLLKTLPKETADNFRSRFVQSLKYWGRIGRGLDDELISEIKNAGIKVVENGLTPHGNKTKQRVVIKSVPDDTDLLTRENLSVISWKRFAITILKNDHTCKTLGLAPTHEQMKRQKEIILKYKNI
jgi:predicted phosphoadenosine phosphosulfate sulfurtransferase